MDLIGVGKSQFWLVVAELLGSGDTQLVQGGLQLLKIRLAVVTVTAGMTLIERSRSRKITKHRSFLIILYF